MDWLQRMNTAMEYIENNLTEDIDFDKAAQMALCSGYHFQRMFGFITGVPLAEYIRRRRLTLAAFELQNSSVGIIDLALKYGYDSRESFSRAFLKLHGVSPSLARRRGEKLKAYPRISFHISMKGDTEMNYRIVEKEAFTIVGLKRTFSMENGANLRDIPKFWREFNGSQMDATLYKIAKSTPSTMGSLYLGVCFPPHDPQKPNEFDYMIAVQSNKEEKDFIQMEVPKAAWAVFKCVGSMPKAIQDMWSRIYTEFFPTSCYERAEGPDFELYPEGDGSKSDYVSEIWVPVNKK